MQDRQSGWSRLHHHLMGTNSGGFLVGILSVSLVDFESTVPVIPRMPEELNLLVVEVVVLVLVVEIVVV